MMLRGSGARDPFEDLTHLDAITTPLAEFIQLLFGTNISWEYSYLGQTSVGNSLPSDSQLT